MTVTEVAECKRGLRSPRRQPRARTAASRGLAERSPSVPGFTDRQGRHDPGLRAGNRPGGTALAGRELGADRLRENGRRSPLGGDRWPRGAARRQSLPRGGGGRGTNRRRTTDPVHRCKSGHGIRQPAQRACVGIPQAAVRTYQGPDAGPFLRYACSSCPIWICSWEPAAPSLP